MHPSEYFIILTQTSPVNINRTTEKNLTKHGSDLLKTHTTPELKISFKIPDSLKKSNFSV